MSVNSMVAGAASYNLTTINTSAVEERPAAVAEQWTSGDENRDGGVDGRDFLRLQAGAGAEDDGLRGWQSNFGASQSLGLQSGASANLPLTNVGGSQGSPAGSIQAQTMDANPDYTMVNPPVGITLFGQTLFIKGDGRDDSAVVRVSGDELEVELAQMSYHEVDINTVLPMIERTTESFPASSITEIRFYGHGGSDQFENYTNIPSIAYGHAGYDQLIGGGADDQLFGGDDNDVLEGRGGDDLLDGGSGNDRYEFSGFHLGADEIVEANYVDSDMVDLSDLGHSSSTLSLGLANASIVSSNKLVKAVANSGKLEWVPTYATGDPDQIGAAIDLAITEMQTIFEQDGTDHLRLKFSHSQGVENVEGTKYADLILGNSRNNSLKGFAGADQIDGRAGNDQIFGGDGMDILRAGSGSDQLSGENDNDRLYGGQGFDILAGGNGDDILVTIGGGQTDRLSGNFGFDSFWLDAETSEVVTDLSSAEQAARHLHRVDAFMENHIVLGDFDWIQDQPSRELLGQNYFDPLPRTAGLDKSDFSSNPLFAGNGPLLTDIDQGSVGDCYFVAFLGTAAKTNPDFIKQTVVDLGDGTYAVRFYATDDAQTPTEANGYTRAAYDPNDASVFVRVDGDLYNMNGNPSYAGQGAEGSIWAPIIEKAWAFYRYGKGTYQSIVGGQHVYIDAFNVPSVGHMIQHEDYVGFTDATDFAESIRDNLNAGKAMLTGGPGDMSDSMDQTSENAQSTPHVFVVSSISNDLSEVELYNPWGNFVTVSIDTLFHFSRGIRTYDI